MSDSELYVIELGYGGDATTIRNLVQCTYTKGGALDVSRRNITAMRRLVRCKDCALYDREDGLCYRDPNHSGYYRPAHDDGFCAWGERREDTDA